MFQKKYLIEIISIGLTFLAAIITPFLVNYLNNKSIIRSSEYEIRLTAYRSFLKSYNEYFSPSIINEKYIETFTKILQENDIKDSKILTCYFSSPLDCSTDKQIASLIGQAQDLSFRRTTEETFGNFRIIFLDFSLIAGLKFSEEVKEFIWWNLYVAPNNWRNDCSLLNELPAACWFDFNSFSYLNFNLDSVNFLDYKLSELLQNNLDEYK